jgi:hypothetical protein
LLALGKRQDRRGEAAQFMIAASELKSQEIEAPVREESFPDRPITSLVCTASRNQLSCRSETAISQC